MVPLHSDPSPTRAGRRPPQSRSRQRVRLPAGILVALAGTGLASCGLLLGGSPGACVSDVAEFSGISDQVYCYSGWDRNECEAYDAEQVNGVNWFFHEGQTCADRGLDEGSNDWP